jgi:hypothetical protein
LRSASGCSDIRSIARSLLHEFEAKMLFLALVIIEGFSNITLGKSG